MPIYNINGINNIDDIKYISQLGDQQLIQALANLGQRIGIKGDSIDYGCFTFLDILNNDYIPNAENTPEIGILNYYLHDGKNCIFSEIGTTTMDEKYVHNKRPLNNLLSENNEENVFYQQFFLNNFSLETKVNNIELYSGNSIFNKDGEILKTLLLGKILGTDNKDINNLEIQYNEFNLTTNTLEKAIRTYYAYSLNNNENYYIMLYFTKSNDNLSYDFDIYILNSKDVLDDIGIDITSLYCFDSINTNEEFTNISDKYVNILNKKYFNEFSLFNLFLNRTYSAKYKGIKLDFNVEENKLIMNESNSTLKYIESILVNTSQISIYNRINYINNDITYLYPQIFAYYDYHSFKLSKSVMYKHILFALYEKLLSEYNIDSSYTDTFPVLYIPLNQKIYYIYNKSNEFFIYFSNSIHVNKIDLSTYTSSKIKEILQSDVILFDFSCVKENDISKTYDNKQSVYQINFKYNDKYESLINNINVINIYTLPYVNTRNNWVINDIDTNITAKATVINDQTLLIISNSYNKETNKITCNLISNINNDEIFNSSIIDDNITEVAINSYETLKCLLPTLDEDNFEYFKDILLVLISDSSCIFENEISQENNSNSLGRNKLCTFWQTNIDNDNNMSFNILMFENEIFDIKNIFNFDDLKIWFKQNIDMENNMFDKILFNINQTISWNQSVTNETEYTGKIEFIDAEKNLSLIKNVFNITQPVDEYYNNLNLILGVYNDTGISTNDNGYISDVLNRFIDNTSSLDITNVCYYAKESRNYNENSILGNVEYEEIIKTINTFEDVGNVELSIDLSNSLNTIKLSDILERQFINTYKITEIIEKINYSNDSYIEKFYNEFDFNKNVPEIDIKEYLLKNINVLNRLNILSLNSEGNLYNAWLGTNYNDTDKDELILTSTYLNINIGKNTLISPENAAHFYKHDIFRIIFNKIKFDAQEIEYSNNVQIFNYSSSSQFKYDIYSYEYFKPKTIHLNSLIDQLYNVYSYTNSDPLNNTMISPLVNGNNEVFLNIICENLFKYDTTDNNSMNKLFNSLVILQNINDNNYLYWNTYFNNNGITFIETSQSTYIDKLIINWSYILRKENIINENTFVSTIYYNNVKCESIEFSKQYNTYFKYGNNTGICWDKSIKNPNIFSIIDKSDFIFITNENSLFVNGPTILLNTPIDITYWQNENSVILCINDGNLKDKTNNVKLYFSEKPTSI